MRKVILILLTLITLTSCASFESVISSNGFNIDPFDNTQYSVNWE